MSANKINQPGLLLEYLFCVGSGSSSSTLKQEPIFFTQFHQIQFSNSMIQTKDYRNDWVFNSSTGFNNFPHQKRNKAS